MHDTSLLDDRIVFAGLKKRSSVNAVKLTRGLRSGERNTDLTNTLLNRAQFEMVKEDVKDIFKNHLQYDLVDKQMHKGDDIAVFTYSWISSVLLNIGMRNAGQLG